MLWDFLEWFGMRKNIPILLFPPEGLLLITHCLGKKYLDLGGFGVEIQVGIFQVFPCRVWKTGGQQVLAAGRRIWSLTGRNFSQCSSSLASTQIQGERCSSGNSTCRRFALIFPLKIKNWECQLVQWWGFLNILIQFAGRNSAEPAFKQSFPEN